MADEQPTENSPAYKPRSMWAEDGENFVIGYMCLTDFECEIGAAKGGNSIYPSVHDCKRSRRCVDFCGIVKVKVEALEIVQRPKDYDHG